MLHSATEELSRLLLLDVIEETDESLGNIPPRPTPAQGTDSCSVKMRNFFSQTHPYKE
jgi:hypothetical protein